MLKGFYCPDGFPIKVEDCLKECRLGDRCQEVPDLVLMSEERVWNGKPSTTQLINGTMYTFLQLTKPYYADPDKRMFMIQGTKHHQELDKIARQLGMASEVALSIDRDIFDLIVWTGKGLALVDRKMWGSFKVAKALGIVEVGKIADPNGEVYKSSGKWGKAGEPKMIPSFGIDLTKTDNWEAELQLNRYRIMLQDLGVKVVDMYLRVLVRDGGLYIAKDRGITRNSYKIPVKFLPDDKVRDYFNFKEGQLKLALNQGYWDTPCTVDESWGGVKCKDYCEVWDYCNKGRLIHSIGGDTRNESK
jgi:hypothetical protein